MARSRGHGRIGVEHLLLALLEDVDAARSLEACGVDLTRLRAELEAAIDTIAQSGEAPPPPAHLPFDASLDTTLAHARAAAREASRREINSFIVLAAIVGQEESPAARILERHGFTFERALETLKTSGRPAAAPTPPPPPLPAVPDSARQPAGGTPPIMKAGATDAAKVPPPRAEAPAPTSVPPPRPTASARQPQSADDIMASIRNMTPPSRPAGPSPKPQEGPSLSRLPRPTPPPPAARPVPSPAAPPPSQAARMPPPPGAAMPTAPAPAKPSPSPPLLDLGAPLPEDRMSAQARPGREPVRSPMTEPPPMERAGEPRLRSAPPLYPAQPPVGLPQPSAGPQRTEPSPAPPSVLGRPEAAPSPVVPSEPRAPAQEIARAQPGQGPALETGRLVEAIPRVMRVAVPETVEVRIAKRQVEAVASGIKGRGPVVQHDIILAKAMSVRLTAPEGGFLIEAAAPETQWVENALGIAGHDDFAAWRWVVTPRSRGRSRLLLIVSARTVGGDGLAAETALPDQVIEVKVRTNYGLTARRWGGWALAAVIGGVLGKFGEGGVEALRRLAGL